MALRRAQKPLRQAISGSALALLFLFTQLSTFAHLLLVRHVTCPEHGGLIHVTAASAAPDAPELGQHFRTAPRVASAHCHDHCLAVSSRRGELKETGPLAAGAGRCLGPAEAPLERGLASPPAVALLRLAPKSSPPA